MKKAFTLAEVLITLGIVGVVAALTLPVFIAKYQMKTYEVAFKKEYSVLSNTVAYLSQEEGIYECYAEYLKNSEGHGYYSANNAQCSDLKHALIKNLKLSSINYDNNIYKSSGQVLAEGGTLTNKSVAYQAIIPRFSSYMLPDGAVLLMLAPDAKLAAQVKYGYSVFVIDVNGKKGPNKWGYDAFYLSFTKNKDNPNIIITDEFGTIVEKGGVRPKAYLTNQKEKSSAMGL